MGAFDFLAQKRGAGMGDVQQADSFDRRLPVMQQGFGSPLKDMLAQGPGASRDPEQIDNLYNMMQGVVSGGVKSVEPAQDLYNLAILQKMRAGSPLIQKTTEAVKPQSVDAALMRWNARLKPGAK